MDATLVQRNNDQADISEIDTDKNHTDNKTKVKMKQVDVLKEIYNIPNNDKGGKANGIGHSVEPKEDKIEKVKNKEDCIENERNIQTSSSVKKEETRDINESLSQLIKNRNDYAELDDTMEAKNKETESAKTNENVNNIEVELEIQKNGYKELDIDSEEEVVIIRNEGDGIQRRTNAPEVDIRITMAVTDSSLEDDEVKTIMESCDELDQKRKERNKRTRKLRRPRKYEEIKMGRKRSKSIDNGTLQSGHNFDFTKYGISVGSGIPNDLLPGIEDYLCNVLANESLSEYAEEQRQYFLERLDIIKLPPSIPPRPQSLGIRLYPVHSSPPLSNRDSIPSLEQDDFAAYQRELSRALLGETPTSPDTITEQIIEKLKESEVKVYDDIDTTGGSPGETKIPKTEEEESMYEIPQLQRTLSDSGYEKAIELSPMSKSTSSEEQLSGQSGPPMPPPLPPRGERTASDAASRSSIGSLLEDRMSDTPVYRAKLNRESSVPARLEKSSDARSEKSNDDLFDEEYDGASCDSLDEVGTLTRGQDPDLRIQLPRPVKRKHIAHHRKLGKSLSSLWEITQPFSMLEDVVISGELHYRSKLTWTRKIVALTNGRLVCYKVDKTDSRPAFVILLTGYEATFHKREGRRSFEVHLDHENFESYVFLVDFKEWAETWCEHINAAAKGQRAAGPVVHLARSSMIANQDGTYRMANSNVQLSNSNASLASSDGFEAEPGTVKVKKRDQSGLKTAKMGTFAFKATQFFESLGRKSSVRKTTSTGSERSPSVERIRQSSGSQSSLGDMSEKLSPITPDSHIEESPLESPLEMKKHIKHQGYVDIYSSFNKRKWGKRWCLVHENNFECYRTQTSEVCELEFLLRNCILRRAIEETKSELGLMLLENNREKITIEPINWTELGSWLRILMQETSTQATPKGLEGYMDDTHPYHEAVEITRVPDPANRQSTLSVQPRGRSFTSPSEEHTKFGSHDNRDSGICSSESTDDRFNSLERNLNSPTVHPCFTDSSLPRVSVSDTGAIYTQVKKPSLTGSTSSPTTGSRKSGNKSKGNLTNFESDVYTDSDKVKANRNSDVDTLFFDFEIGTFDNPSNKRESSLVDEIMSELKIQQSNNSHTAEEEIDDVSGTVDTQPDPNNFIKRKSVEFSPTVSELSPIKSADVTITGDEPDFLCSSFVDIVDKSEANDDKEVICDNEMDSVKVKADDKVSAADEKVLVSVRRHPSNVSAKVVVDVTETLAELRTRLVQLKKDRISIRDRKQQISSERDRGFLEAEYDRLNRECKKVSDEIKQLEQSTGIVSENNDTSDQRLNSVTGEIKQLEQSTGMVSENSETGAQKLNSFSEPHCRNDETIESCSYGSSELHNDSSSNNKESIDTHADKTEDGEDFTEPVCINEDSSRNGIMDNINDGGTDTVKVESITAEEETNVPSDNQDDVKSDIPDTQQSTKDESSSGTLIENKCKQEAESACDNQSVPKINNTLKESKELIKVSERRKSELNSEEKTATDSNLDTLAEDFTHKLTLKES